MTTQYTVREDWLNAFVERARPQFEAAGFPLPEKVRVSVGFTSGGSRGKSIGQCWSDEASADGHFEIFLRPTMQTDARIADVLTHELCHAAVGIAAGHGKRFKACATALGLTGPMKSTTAGEPWYRWALPVLSELGPLPYAELKDGVHSGRKKQATNLLKVECPACGFLARVTRKHIEPHSHLDCPVPTCAGVLLTDMGDEGDEG
jgi:hypothetical protein